MQPGGGFYGEMPDNYEIIVNTEQPAVKEIINLATSSLENEVTPIRAEIETLNNEIEAARKEATDKKEAAPDLSEKEGKVADLRKKGGRHRVALCLRAAEGETDHRPCVAAKPSSERRKSQRFHQAFDFPPLIIRMVIRQK